MSIEKLIYIVIIAIIVFGVSWLSTEELSRQKKNPIHICSVGWGGTCIYTKNVRYENGCAVADSEERICGNYEITK
jgi:hypothetical protein